MLDNIKNFLKNQNKIQLIILILAGIIVVYEILSQIFFEAEAVDSIVQITIMIILIVAGAAVFYYAPRYDIEYAKYPMINHKIILKDTHQGTDGFCCFLVPEDKGVQHKREDDIYLVCGALTKEPEDKTMAELMETDSFVLFSTRKRCSMLNFKYEIKDGFLFIEFGCGEYEKRPLACHRYPLKNDPACMLEKYCSSIQQHLNHFQWATLFFYAVDSKKYPDLAQFSIGTVTKAKKSNYLIPVNMTLNKNIVCKRTEGQPA